MGTRVDGDDARQRASLRRLRLRMWRLAALTDDPDIRAELLEVARSWMQEAQQVGSDANVALAYSGGATQED